MDTLVFIAGLPWTAQYAYDRLKARSLAGYERVIESARSEVLAEDVPHALEISGAVERAAPRLAALQWSRFWPALLRLTRSTLLAAVVCICVLMDGNWVLQPFLACSVLFSLGRLRAAMRTSPPDMATVLGIYALANAAIAIAAIIGASITDRKGLPVLHDPTAWVYMASIACIMYMVPISRRPVNALSHVFDEAFIGLLFAAVVTRPEKRTDWTSQYFNHLLLGKLNDAAGYAESAFRRRAWSTGIANYRRGRTAGLQLSAVITAKNDMIVAAADESAYAEVHEWLLDGLYKWATGGVDEMLRAQPEPSRLVFVRRALRRLVPPAVLVAAGVALPLIPQLSGQGAPIRITLLSAAALALTVGPGQVSDQVMSVVNKASASKGDGS